MINCKHIKLELARTNNAKLYWKMLKGSVVCNSSSLASDDFVSYFKSVNDPDSVFFQPDEDILYFNERYLGGELNIMFEELNNIITTHEIKKCCKKLNNGKSGGPDNFLNEFFKYGCEIDMVATALCTLFNKLFDSGYFPETWSEGYVVPLHKKGDINNTNNYRGITLLSTLGKLFTKVLNDRLTIWAETYNVYIEAQAGFRQNMGTTDNIFVLHSVIHHLLNKKKKLFVAFIDFTKAFDYVVRDILWYKLIKLGIRGKLLNIIRSMYSIVKSRVKYDNEVSDSFTCMVGVRQGESLSPFLFAMYLNDIEEYLLTNNYDGISLDTLKLFIMLYADDIVLFSESETGLQKGLDLLKQYCDRWKLTVNTQKTKVMVFK